MLRVAHNTRHGLEESGRALFEAGDLLFPGEFSLGAIQENFQEFNFLSRAARALIFGVNRIQVRHHRSDGLFAPPNARRQLIYLAQHPAAFGSLDVSGLLVTIDGHVISYRFKVFYQYAILRFTDFPSSCNF